MRDVAFCLVENEKGEVLFVQRAYGKEKGKWSLPGGLVDRSEGSRHAAYRETREETGVIVKITHPLFTGNNNPIKVFVGQRVGGRLRFQKKECLDVRWRNPERIRPEDLAFGGDRKALGLWAYRAERLFDYTNEGSFNDHKVVLVFAGGEPRINDRELESFRWWDGRERLPLYPHVTSIIGRYEAG